MGTHTTANQPGRYSSIGVKACPKCGGDLFRIPRRATDRVTSLLVPVQRFHCHFFSCHWEGNLRVSRGDFAATDPGDVNGIQAPSFVDSRPRVPRSFVVHMVLAVVGVLAILLVTTTDLLAPDLASTEMSDEQWIASARVTRQGPRLGRNPEPSSRENKTVAAAPR